MAYIVIRVPEFDTRVLRQRLVRTFDRRARENERLLLNTTRYFESVNPKFVSDVERTSDGYRILTGPIDDEHGQIWSYLDLGTEVRFATMTDEYSAGTTPGTFETQPSQGDRQFVNTQIEQDPIEARGWSELLVQTELAPFRDNILGTIAKYLRDWGSRLLPFQG